MEKTKPIRVLAYIMNQKEAVVGYVVVNTEIDAVTGVSFEQLYDMKDGVINIKKIDRAKRKVAFIDCASARVPKVVEGGFGKFNSFGAVKDGIWVINKIDGADEYTCYTQKGDKLKLSTNELIIMYNQGILVNATAVQDSFIRGINWTIPVIENPRKIKGLKHISLIVEDDVVSFEIDALEIKLDKSELALMSETDANSGLGKMQTIKFGGKDVDKVTDLLNHLLEDISIDVLDVYLKDMASSSELDFKVTKGEHVHGGKVRMLNVSENAHVSAMRCYPLVADVIKAMKDKAILCSDIGVNVLKTIAKYKTPQLPTGEYIKGLNMLGLTIEVGSIHTFITTEILADDIKIPKSVEHKIDEISGTEDKNTYVQYVSESDEDTVKFLRMFLKGVKVEKVAVALFDRIDEENVSQLFVEATKGEQPIVRSKKDASCAVTACAGTLDEILGNLAKYNLINTTVNADIHKVIKKIK